MAFKFNAGEVLDMAMQIERNGGVFYRKAAENNPEGRDMLLKIARQEDEHLVLFEDMSKELTPQELEATVFDPDGESSMYLKSMADSHVFDLRGNDPAGILKGDESLNEIIDRAIQAEKESIVFFVAMKELVPERLGKERMDHLIKEEMGHITWLNGKRS
jgi:rubrerythrin